MQHSDIELVTYCSEKRKDFNENEYSQVTTNFSNLGKDFGNDDSTDELGSPQWHFPPETLHEGRGLAEDLCKSVVNCDARGVSKFVRHVSESDEQVKRSNSHVTKSDRQGIRSVGHEQPISDRYLTRSEKSDQSVSRGHRLPDQGVSGGHHLPDQGVSRGQHHPVNHHQFYAKGLAMTLNRVGSGFTSYVDLQPPVFVEKELAPEIEAELLPGEMVISQADRVCCYITNAGGTTSGHTGTLFVTTLKLSYRPNLHGREGERRENKLIGDMDVSLSSIHSVYEVLGENGEKRKKLPLGTNVSHKIDSIFVVCKNFKFQRLSFKFSGVDTGRSVTNALLHHSRPKKNELLFAFELSRNRNITKKVATNWENVLKESECPNLRVCRANESWQVSISLPQQFVVPSHVTDELVSQVAGLGLGTRPPVWTWGSRGGGAIFVQPTLNVLPSAVVDSLYDDFYRCSGRMTFLLDQTLPHLSSLVEGFSVLLDLHCMETEREAEERDVKYLSSLESTGWMAAMGSVLRLAGQVAELVVGGQTVVLVEGGGRGASLLVSSLVHLLLSEEARTRVGFEGLVQSHWVSLGFPFARSHALSGGTGGGLNPLFLLFLDCVHQIGLQFPSKLEFLPEYLVTVWDTALLPVFDTFIMDSEHDRALARWGVDDEAWVAVDTDKEEESIVFNYESDKENPLQLHSAWDWSQQFSTSQMDNWTNPLFGVPLRPPRSSPLDPSLNSMIMSKETLPNFPESKKFLNVSGDIANLCPWYQLFHRSVPFLKINDNWSKGLSKVRREAKTEVSTVMNSTHQSRGGFRLNNKNHHKSNPR